MTAATAALPHLDRSAAWRRVAAAAAIFAVTMGIQQSLGLFAEPIAADTAFAIAQIGVALGAAQLAWGLAQLLFGVWCDGAGRSSPALLAGGMLMAAGAALAPLADSPWVLTFAFAMLGGGAGSFSALAGALARQSRAENFTLMVALVCVGGSAGQFALPPYIHAAITAADWTTGLRMLSALVVIAVLLALVFRDAGRRAATTHAPAAVGAATAHSLAGDLATALRQRDLLLLQAGFFLLGLHVAFLNTHMPIEAALCGLNDRIASAALLAIGCLNVIAGLLAGWLGRRFRMRSLLAMMHASRVPLIALYLLSPPTQWVLYGFSAGLGLMWLATLPPAAGWLRKQFSTRILATLVGLVLFWQQIGAFLGGWLGELAFVHFGHEPGIWYADMALAALTALAHLLIRERKPERLVTAA